MAIRKTILGLFLAILGPIPLFAGVIGTNQFSGLNSQDNPASLQPNQAQDLLNVRLQPGGKAVYKRDGYGLFQTINSTYTTHGIHGGYHFQQTGGADVQLWASSSTLYGIVNDIPAVALATGTVDATWQCTDNLGFAYCVTSANDTPVKTDGTPSNTSYQLGIPAGTMIASTPLQLVVAGVSGNASTVYISSNNGFSYFGSGPLPTDPYTEIINAPGSRITTLGYYFGNLYWWKDQSFGYISGSASQGTVGITIVSNQIGTLDNSTAFWNPTTYDQGNKFGSGTQTLSTGNPYFNEMSSLGGIFFRGQDNHIYQYDGYSLTRLSRIITPSITASSRKKANSWTQTSASDWNNGVSSPTLAIDTTTSQGDVMLLHSNTNVPDNSFENSANQGWIYDGIYFTQSGSSVTDHCTVTPQDGTKQLLFNETCGPSWNFLSIFASTTTWSSGSVPSTQCNFNQAINISQCSWTLNSVILPSNCIGIPIKISFGASAVGTYHINQQVAAFVSSISSNVFTFYANTDSLTTGGGCPAHQNVFIDNILGGQTTSYFSGTYLSAIDNAPNLTSWSTFGVDDQSNGGTLSYYIRASTNTFAIISSTPAWVAQTKNSKVSASTGTYMQARVDFAIDAATETPTLSDFTFNWFEGTSSDKAYIQYFQDAILFSMSSGTSTATNNTIFNLDLLNNAWLKDNIPANGFLVENNALYIGDPLSATVYKYGGVPTDKAGPIQSYWKSKDFTGDDPTVQNDWDLSDFLFAQSSTTVTFSYTTDQSTTLARAPTFSLYSPNHSIVKRGFNLDHGTIGTFLNWMIGDNSSLPAWVLLAQKITYNVLPWRQQISQ